MGSGGDLAGGIARGDIRLYRFAPLDKASPSNTDARQRLRYLSTATVAPITSSIRGVPSEVRLDEEDGMKGPCAVNLHNPVTVSQQRLGVAHLAPLRMREVCAALRFSLGCDAE